ELDRTGLAALRLSRGPHHPFERGGRALQFEGDRLRRVAQASVVGALPEVARYHAPVVSEFVSKMLVARVQPAAGEVLIAVLRPLAGGKRQTGEGKKQSGHGRPFAGGGTITECGESSQWHFSPALLPRGLPRRVPRRAGPRNRSRRRSAPRPRLRIRSP